MISSRERAPAGQRGMISAAEAIMLAVMTAVVVAIAVPSLTAMQARSHDSAARADVRQTVEAVEAMRAERGSYAGIGTAAIHRFDSALGRSTTRVAYADRSGYCVQSTRGGRTWHYEGPAGDVVRGSCP